MEPVTIAVAAKTAHPYPFAYGQGGFAGKALQVVDDLISPHEPLRIVAVVGKVGEPALPVGRHKAEGIPPLLLPSVADAVLLEHQGRKTPLLETMGHG